MGSTPIRSIRFSTPTAVEVVSLFRQKSVLHRNVAILADGAVSGSKRASAPECRCKESPVPRGQHRANNWRFIGL